MNLTSNTVQLKLINKSDDQNNSQVLIFQENNAINFARAPIAWRVLPSIPKNSFKSFTFSPGFEISASDSRGNYTTRIATHKGQQFEIVHTPQGEILKLNGASPNANEIVVKNALNKGAFNIQLYRDSKLLGLTSNLIPQQITAFDFRSHIHIGVYPNVIEGQVLDATVLSQINTQISLLGIKSADIVWTGGGSGPTAVPFNFTLDNVKY